MFRAVDTRLGRAVAIKTAHEQFSNCFEREARAIASLNHPNVCQLYDIGSNYLVMELVEGPTLADRIKAGAVPVEEALAIARQIGDALDAAHEKGIVHRDLKPANIKITPDDTVKVLDFGLAKIAGQSAPATESLTVPMEATAVSHIMGTAAYISPEQARGKAVDKRADIWAFGVVLYEMLTGPQAVPRRDYFGHAHGCTDQRAGMGTRSSQGAAAIEELPGEGTQVAVARHRRCLATTRRHTRASGRQPPIRDCRRSLGNHSGSRFVGTVAQR